MIAKLSKHLDMQHTFFVGHIFFFLMSVSQSAQVYTAHFKFFPSQYHSHNWFIHVKKGVTLHNKTNTEPHLKIKLTPKLFVKPFMKQPVTQRMLFRHPVTSHFRSLFATKFREKFARQIIAELWKIQKFVKSQRINLPLTNPLNCVIYSPKNIAAKLKLQCPG